MAEIDSWKMSEEDLATRRTRPKGEARRLAILAAAHNLFSRHGYRGTSLASIAEDVGLTQPGLLHHFRSKRDLLNTILDERDRRDIGEMEEEYAEGQDTFTALGGLMKRNARSRETVRSFTVLVSEAAVSDTHPAHEHFVERYRRVIEITAARLENTISPNSDAKVIARLLLAAMDGLQIQWLLDPEFDMSAAFDAFASRSQLPPKRRFH